MQNYLRVIRKRKGLTLKELSSQTGLSIGAIGNFETGERGISDEALRTIASALSVPIAEILHQDGAVEDRSNGELLDCQKCRELERSLNVLRAELQEARAVIRDQASAIAALASKPTHRAAPVCGAEEGLKSKRGA